jgi:hypothetical protein
METILVENKSIGFVDNCLEINCGSAIFLMMTLAAGFPRTSQILTKIQPEAAA